MNRNQKPAGNGSPHEGPLQKPLKIRLTRNPRVSGTNQNTPELDLWLIFLTILPLGL